MISLIRCLKLVLGKRGELRYGNILPAPKLSSSCRVLKYLSSRVLLKMSLRGACLRATWQSQQNVNNQPRSSRRIFNPPQDDKLNKLIGRFLEFFAMQKIGMTLLVGIFSLFLLFPLSTNSAIYFLPDAQWDVPVNVSIDSSQCEDVGYTYYSLGVCPAYHNQETCVFNDKYLKCDGTGWCKDNGYTLSSCSNPKVLTTQCPNGFSLYKSCVCPSTYKYTCTGTGEVSGSGVACDNKYTACICANTYKYTCSGAGYGGGSGTACNSKYTSCTCASGYHWSGSACVVHSYACPSGYSASSSGMISPASTSKVCSCGATSGTCYKETHTHSYACPSGYSASSSGMISPTSASKVCSCGAKSGTCYKETHSHSYYCPSGYSTSSSGMISPTSTSKVCSCGATSGTCYKETHTHSYACPSGYSASSSGMISPASTSKVCSCGATSGTCYKETHTHSYVCPSGSSASCSNGYYGTISKTCSVCAAVSGTCYMCCSSEYKYSCSGTGYSGGENSACGGKYRRCICADGYGWNSSAGTCDYVCLPYRATRVFCNADCGNSCTPSGSFSSQMEQLRNTIPDIYLQGQMIAYEGCLKYPNSKYNAYIAVRTECYQEFADAGVSKVERVIDGVSACGGSGNDRYDSSSQLIGGDGAVSEFEALCKVNHDYPYFYTTGCNGTTGTYVCSKSPHSHSFTCPSGTYSTSSSCSAGFTTVSKTCVCGEVSGAVCYKCNSGGSSSSSSSSSSGGGTSGSCTVGSYYYTDKTCSSSYNSSKTVAGIVVKDNALVMSEPVHIPWSTFSTNVSGLTDIHDSSTAIADMNGKSNTSAIVSEHQVSGETPSSSAALYCYHYYGNSAEMYGTLNNWYLPAAGELHNYVSNNRIMFVSRACDTLGWDYWCGMINFWSSSEYNDGAAWVGDISGNTAINVSKSSLLPVSCFLDISGV